MAKFSKTVVLTLFCAFLLIASLNAFASVNAQGDATVVVLDSVGGTVDPSGTNTYADATPVTLTATAVDQVYVFANWVISSDSGDTTSTDNPLTLTVTGGVTYAVQAVFQPVQAPIGKILPPDLSTAAIVVVLSSAGGTTIPAPGTYAMANAENLDLQAMPTDGWQFSHWTISGASTDHGGAPVNLTPTDNPYNVNHGYGYTYNYQAVFTPVGSTVPTPTPTPGGTLGGMSNETWIIIGLVIVIVVILIGFGVYAAKRKTH